MVFQLTHLALEAGVGSFVARVRSLVARVRFLIRSLAPLDQLLDPVEPWVTAVTVAHFISSPVSRASTPRV